MRAVVVVDAADIGGVDPRVRALADEVLLTGGRRGAPAARNLGASATDDPYVAFLDDDDEWHSAKIEKQMAAMRAANERTVVSCRVRLRAPSGAVRRRPVPRRRISPGAWPEDYLFRRRIPGPGRASIFTSTLLVPRLLVEEISWDEDLKRHQDWDWLIRAAHMGHATVVQVADPLVNIDVGSPGSISATANWQASLEWGRSWQKTWSRPTYADFLVGQPLRYALQARSLGGSRTVLSEVRRVHGAPSAQALAVALAGLAPRGVVQNVMTTGAKLRPGRDGTP